MATGPQGTEDGVAVGSGAHTGAIAGIVLVVGAVLPGAGGLLPLGLAVLVAATIATARLRARGSWGWPALLRFRGPGARYGLACATSFAALVLVAVLGRVIAQLAIAFPGALPAIVLVLVVALVRQRLGRGAWLLPPAVLACALLGARCEADGEDARGAMHSGALHGIHPFQTTAVIVDGYGPFDVPINDYVEPLGGRGYDPPALAEAIELALHRIAEVHFAEGPSRARQAFAEATAQAESTTPILERLDRDPPPGSQWRFGVTSGTTGQRSRVEFVCPGRRDEPRPPPAEAVMSRMCPDKYANEASAGLSVTGRWPGYVEIRGNERLGLSRLLGWTRSDDAAGIAMVELESWLWVVIVAAVAAASVLRRRAGGLVDAAVPLALPLGLMVLVVALARSELGQLPASVDAPSWLDPWRPQAWLGALAWPAAAGLVTWIDRAGGRARAGGWPLVAALVLVGVAATDLAALQWLAPRWHEHGATAAIEPWVITFADALATAVPLPILELEALVAAAIAAPCIVALVTLVHAAASAWSLAARGPAARGAWRFGTVLVVLGAIALAWSRKTDGGVALIPAAVGVALACGSAAQRIGARGPWPSSHAQPFAIVIHLGWTALALWLIVGVAPADGDPLRWLYTAIAALAAVLPIACCVGDPEPGAAANRGASGGAREVGSGGPSGAVSAVESSSVDA